MTLFDLRKGSVELNEDLNGWVITSPVAIVDGSEDMPLQKGDRININGDVYRDNEFIGNVA